MRFQRVSYGYTLVLSPAAPQTAWRPMADVYETPSTISVTVELAGIEPEEVDVLFFDNAIVVEGKRPLPQLDGGGIYHSAEIRRGLFRLELGLPARVDSDPIELSCQLGLLTIRLVKALT
jgi:HSP20 family protein